MSFLRRIWGSVRPVGLAVLAGAAASGCATTALNAARHDFYAGRYDRAEQSLVADRIPDIDRVLMLMERGMARQAAGRYADSSRDFVDASDRLEELQTYSVSKGAASWVVNDGVQSFRGAPFERTLLHVFTAMNHLALANWDEAGVEARRILKTLQPENRGNYPDDACSRYVAGLGLELNDDPSNAELQYREAAGLSREALVNPATGHLLPWISPSGSTNVAEIIAGDRPWDHELVCFILLGRAPTGREQWDHAWAPPPPVHAVICHEGRPLGRSYTLTDTAQLAFTTDQIEALRKAAKTAGRIALKEVIAQSVESKNDDGLGDLVRFVLIGLLEQPDLRRWETLPRWLQVARVPCPRDLDRYEIRLVSSAGHTVRTVEVGAPITRRRNLTVSFWRDTPPPLAGTDAPKPAGR
jgi:hypothetical protein